MATTDDHETGAAKPPFDRFQLQKWANTTFPEKVIKPTVFLGKTESTIAILDKYPKAIFHVLILPRPREGVALSDLDTLRTLLGSNSRVKKERAKEERKGRREGRLKNVAFSGNENTYPKNLGQGIIKPFLWSKREHSHIIF